MVATQTLVYIINRRDRMTENRISKLMPNLSDAHYALANTIKEGMNSYYFALEVIVKGCYTCW